MLNLNMEAKHPSIQTVLPGTTSSLLDLTTAIKIKIRIVSYSESISESVALTKIRVDKRDLQINSHLRVFR